VRRCVLLLLLATVMAARAENWPQLYNTGVKAYESNDFAQAAAMFENATASQDRALQQRALYNLGNTDYRLGQAQPQQAQRLWQRALKSYESALALDPNDADVKFNHEYVKQKIEELKKQQQQQQNQKNQQDKKQDQKKDDQQQQQKQDQQQDQQQQKPEDKQADQQPQAQEQQKQEQQKKDDEQKQQAQQEKPSQEEPQPQQKDGQQQNPDKQQAAALLDNLRENERNWNFFPEVQMKDLKDSGPPAKDW